MNRYYNNFDPLLFYLSFPSKNQFQTLFSFGAPSANIAAQSATHTRPSTRHTVAYVGNPNV